MINIINISENFNKHKSIIISLLVDYYGQEYYSLINTRINSTYIDFSSTPVEDYKYTMRYTNEISPFDKLIINLRYKLYRRLEDKSRKTNFDLLTKYVFESLLITDQNKIKSNMNLFISLFSDENFNSGLIDAFSSKSTSLLRDNNVAASIKESIIRDQEKFKKISNELGINVLNLSTDSVDELIAYRKKLQANHKNYIVQNSQFGRRMCKAIKREFNLELQPEILSIISFIENSYAGNIIVENDNNTSYYNYIRIPLIHLINIGVKGLDVNIIHELIHKVETDRDCVGISILNAENTNDIINEIRTQKLAIHITKILHEQGIFIYDNPKDYKIEGESTYEWMFPLTENFLDKFEDVFSNCAINNDSAKLKEFFGNSWVNYSQHINDVYNNNMYFFSQFGKIPNIQMEKSVASMIDDMELVYNKGGKKHV